MGQHYVGTNSGPANGASRHETPCRWKQDQANASPIATSGIVASFQCRGKPRTRPEIAHIQQFRKDVPIFIGRRRNLRPLAAIPTGSWSDDGGLLEGPPP